MRLRSLPARLVLAGLILFAWCLPPAVSQSADPSFLTTARPQTNLPPRVAQARRFLARRGVATGQPAGVRVGLRANGFAARPEATGAPAAWQPLGPTGVLSSNYGLVTGRVSSLALDPADPTGNRLFVGTTGGGVWLSQNAGSANPANIVFTPLTDNLGALNAAIDPSISVGAITVQPGGTGVVLAGTGDPNDVLDSYYGAGILRSADGGNSWSLIQTTGDLQYTFAGEGFAGFAWSTTNPQVVVAAVSQAWEGVLVGADFPNRSYEGLYYSADSGATWSLARITDLNGQDVQGPLDAFTQPDGNAATSVVWNGFRGMFIAAVRFHGYYQSADGVQWTRLSAQPGANLTTALCPTRPTDTGSPACPMYRGTLAVNPLTGDTFAWTVDLDDQDQGVWQDACAANGNACTNSAIAFAKWWDTSALEIPTPLGLATIQNGNYDLALAAIPSGQDTILLSGANDLWKCSLAMGCVWRNTTNATTCMSAGVAEYQHALEWDANNPLELFVGNDSGLWRSTDGIAETGTACSSGDSGHFQNLNGGLGSLAEVESMSAVGASPYTMMLGLGANGTAGVKSTAGPTAVWPEILSGEGGPVAIDPTNPSNWYVNNGTGVSIHLCSQDGACTPADFGLSPVVSSANVGGDGMTMTSPAPFLVDPVDSAQLLIGTCRLWRGPASGMGWTMANAVAPMFDGNRNSSYCNGNALIRSMAAVALPGGGEVVYVGTYGSLNGGGAAPGHVLSTTMSASGAWSPWVDLTINAVTNDQLRLNYYGFDISSLFIDPRDSTGNTIYATVEGIPNPRQNVCVVYRSVDGGAHWSNIRSNLTSSAANSLVVAPQDSNTAYLATDAGVYFTRNVASCGNASSTCWSQFGSGLPAAPVVALSAAPAATTPNSLVAATYGRGVWQIPLATASIQLTSATLDPASIDFGAQPEGSASSIHTVTLANTGGIALAPTATAIGGANAGDFTIASDRCTGKQLNRGATCDVELVFAPDALGDRSAALSVSANVQGGQLSTALAGKGLAPGNIKLMPTVLNFDNALSGPTAVGTTSKPLSITVENSGVTAVPVTSVSISGPFVLASNVCATTSVAANSDCQLTVEFQPATPGPATGALTLIDGAGTQTVVLTGTGAAPPTDALSTLSLSFPPTIIGQSSAPLTVGLSNTGDLPLTSIAVAATGAFQVSSNCSTKLAANSSCSINVVFTPTQPGAQSGILTVSDITNPGQKVALSGNGVLPPVSGRVQIVPAQVNFPTTGVGTSSSPVTLTIMNSDDGADLTGLSLSVSSGFKLVNNICGATLPSGATCTTGASFTPTGPGSQNGTFTVSSNALASSVTAHLSGMGFDFQVTMSGASTVTVSSGQTANYTLGLAPLTASPGTFAFQCGKLPSYAACIFNPSTETVAAGATGTEGVQITTGQSSSAQITAPAQIVAPASGGGRVLTLVFTLLMLPLAWRRRKLRFPLAVLAILLLGFSGCSSSGGGSGGAPPSSPTTHTTPAGTYAVPVTVTSNGVQHAVTLTLVVD
ncbi:MAG TPA: choice-of-anchor D domain-containing protein [Terracidiphilus sp.]